MKHIAYGAIAMLLAMVCPAFAQSQQEIVNRLIPHPFPPSPNVAALGKFGDYRASNYNGLPDISIPLYEIKNGSLSLPITLSYHASGIKPTDVASWVGTGWGISAGGQISASVQGKTDSEHYTTHPLNPNPTVCQNFYYLNRANKGVIDTEADIYMYSYPGGRMGKVMFLNTGTWVSESATSPNTLEPYLVPYAPISLKMVNAYKFEITDENGVLYRYGIDENGNNVTEGTTTYVGGQQFQATTAFHMTEMIAPNSKDKISFAYQPVGTSHSHDISYTYVVTDLCNSKDVAVNRIPCPIDNPIPQLTNIDSDVNQLGVSTITFKTGMVKFYLGETRKDVSNGLNTVQSPLKSLDHIDVFNLVDGSYVLLKTIRFEYNYFTDAAGAKAALKLDAVYIQDSGGKVIQRYKFGYKTTTFSWTAGATASLNARDLWGYYNGATQNTDLVMPRQLIVQRVFSGGTPETVNIGHAVNRTSNELLKQEGVLNRIDFPTGGYTTFEYESNKYAEAGTPVLAGGLRIKKITSSDGASAFPIVKTYRYGIAEDGIGYANFNPVRFNYNAEQQYLQWGYALEPGIQYRIQTFQSGTAYAADPFDSSPVGYDYVTEYTENNSAQRLGYTRYHYENVQNYVDQVVMMSSKSYNNSVGWQRGQLSGKVVADSLGKVVSSMTTDYALFHTTTDRYVSLAVHDYIPPLDLISRDPALQFAYCYNEVGEAVSPDKFKFAKFTQSSGAKLPITQTEYVYDKNDATKFVKTITNLTYDPNNLQVTKSVATHSNGYEQRVTENIYPFQMAAVNESATSGNAKGVSMMKRKHMISQPLETITYLQKSDNSNQRIVSAQATTFRQNDSDTSFVVADKIYVWESEVDVPRTSYQPVTINAAKNGVTLDPNQKLRASFLSYDNNGNVQFVQKANDMPVSYLYGYNKSLPVAQVLNAQNTYYTTVQSNVQTRTSLAISPNSNNSNTVTQSYDINVAYAGTVYLKLSVNGAAVGYTTRMSYNGITGDNDIVLAKNGCSLTVVTMNNVAPGHYTVTVTLTASPDGTGAGVAPPNVGACGVIDYPTYTTVTTPHGVAEFVYESFEETSAANIVNNVAVAHSGNKYLNTDYTANWTKPNARDYWIDYWYLDTDSKWKYLQKTYTGSSSSSMFLTEGSAIDDVRIYPKDAQMTTYTYIPNTGTTSVMDPNGKMLFYEYDTFGRLKLTRDTNLNILKTYDYYYKIQP
ncbi:hypothetical protein [Chryseolinea soli]|uniref:RHS repeat protein n=1 Tax=Chryseolinea soli TaxID=2321403 RepID=A0A385SRI5_9BACT|nr:hypothetical protein [Chryseolinea soli]AYB33472.1 hypothetical protein D4L85_24065 [Chryseolinea soli]